jgi:Arc/MetJ-type ribon-helix-helix transcriptional regulator
MIQFEEISKRLEGIGKDRKWLAENSGRSYDSIRTALAKKAAPKSRSALLQKALTDAIEREEAEQAKKPELTKAIALEPSIEEYRLWSEAFKSSPYSTIEEWAVASLNGSSGALHVLPTSMVAEEPPEYGAKRRPK